MTFAYISTPKKILLAIVTLLVCLYIGFSIYLKIVADDLVEQTIGTIKVDYPQVKNITYQSTNFSPFDFLDETFGINGVHISFNDSDVVLNISNIRIRQFMGLTKKPFGSFTVNFHNLTLNSLQDLYTTVATWTNNSILYSQLGNIPAHLSLSMDGGFKYDVTKQALDIHLNELQAGKSFFRYKTSFSPLLLNKAFFTNQTTFLHALNNTAIQSSSYNLNINNSISVADISNTSPLLGNFLQNLSYATLPVHMDITSNYQGGEKEEAFHANINIQELGDLHMEWTILFDTPPTPYNLANLLLNPGNPQINMNAFTIRSADVTYTDRSFMPRLFNYLSNTMGQPVSAIQDMTQNVLTNYAAETDIPQFSSISNELSSFVANPGTLSFNLNPVEPFSLQYVTDFFSKRQKLNSMLAHDMLHLSSKDRSKLFKRYEGQASEAYSEFFNRIGLSVVANSSSN